MKIIKDIVSLESVNPERFSRVVSMLSIEDPLSYDTIIDVITKSKNLSGSAKSYFVKKELAIDDDLFDAINSFVSFTPEVSNE